MSVKSFEIQKKVFNHHGFCSAVCSCIDCQGDGQEAAFLLVILIFFFICSADHLVISGGCGAGDIWHFCHMEQNLVLNAFFCASKSVYLRWKE